MKKKVLSILLSMLLLSSGVLTGCSSLNGEDETVEATADVEESSRISMTLTLWLPTSEDTTDEAIALVEEAINDVTQAKFDTAIELHAIPQDEYQKAIDARMAEIGELKIAEEEAAEQLKEAKKQKKDADEEETETVFEEETYVNDLGITVIKYPEVENTQMDIFLVQGYDNYLRYIDEDLIQQLDSELSSTSKILKTYIYPNLLDMAKKGGRGTYAIPNNRPCGEYEFLLVNKELVEKYDYDIDNMQSLSACQDFIIDIGSKNLDGVIPLLDDCDLQGIRYWSIDGEWSLLASQITNVSDMNATPSPKVAPKSVLIMSTYNKHITNMKKLNELGYVGDGTLEEGEKFAVGIIAGDASVVEEYGDEYHILIHSKPVADVDDIYGNMFAVSTYSKNLARSMEIITMINTNTELRTILQYGVEGVHWQIDPDNEETIEILSDDYQMDLYATGNVYMTYPGEGRTMDEWEFAKQQNLDSITSPYLLMPDYLSAENKAMMEELAKVSKEWKERLDNMTSEEFENALSDLKKEIKDLEIMIEVTNKDNANSPVGFYEEFYVENFPAA